MSRRKKVEHNVFSQSFIDVFANTLGGLAFILIIVILLMGLADFLVKPLINTERLPDAYNGIPWEIWLSAREGQGIYNWEIIEGELPPGLEMTDSTLGYIKGIPKLDKEQKKSEFRFKIQVDSGKTDSSLVSTQEYVIQLKESPFGELEILTNDTLPIALNRENYPLTFSATGGKNPYSWKMITNELKGIQLNGDGKLNGIVDSNEGFYALDVQVSDNFKNTLRKKFTLKVVDNPEPCIHESLNILTDTLPDAVKNHNYKITFAAEGGYHPYSWEVSQTVPGLKSNTKGELSGLPDKIGNYKITTRVTDSKGEKSQMRNFVLQILPPPLDVEPLQVLSASELPKLTTNSEMNWALSGVGGVEPYFWRFANASPDSLDINLSENGILTGSFNKPGDYSFSINLTDSEKAEVSQLFNISVLPEGENLVLKTDTVPYAVKGYVYNCTLSASGGFPPYKWTLDSTLPTGLSFTNGVIKGIAQVTWNGQIKVECEDQNGSKDKKLLSFVVLESGKEYISPRLEIITPQIPSLLVGEEYLIPISITGGISPYEWVSTGEILSGLEFDKGVFLGKITSSSSDSINILVSDASGQHGSTNLVLNSSLMIDYWWKLIAFISLLLMAAIIIWALTVLRKLRKAKKYPIEIKTKAIPNARCSFNYTCYLSAIGGIPPYKWEVVEGELPDGLTLSINGLISGSPLKGMKLNTIKDFDFTVEVRDSIGNTAKQQL